VILLGPGGAREGAVVSVVSLLKVMALWMVALRLVLLLGYESVVVTADGL
jgi:hypothetical protein